MRANVLAARGELAHLPEEAEDSSIGRTELAGDSEPARAEAQREAEHAGDEVVGSLLQRRAVTVGDTEERQPAAPRRLVEIESRLPLLGHWTKYPHRAPADDTSGRTGFASTTGS